MSIRESINEKPWIAVCIGLMLIVAALCSAVLSSRGNGTPPSPAKYFYSADDGRTTFDDDATLVPPFVRDGKVISRAVVVQGKDGNPTVAYLQRYTQEGLEALTAINSQLLPPYDPKIILIAQSKSEVKRPLEPRWHSVNNASGARIVNDPCGDGSTPKYLLP
jgi:hypothetical protein